MFRQNLLSHLRGHAGGGRNRGSVGSHDLTPERLLFVGNLHHVHQAVQAKIGTCHGKGCPPLSGACLRGDAFQPLLFGIICLGNGGIQLMASACVIALKLIIDFCRCLQFFLQTIRPHQGRGPVHFIKILDFLRNGNISRSVVQFLRNQFIAENPLQFFRSHGLQGTRIQKRRRLILHVCTKIVPAGGNFIFLQINFIWNFFHFTHS